MNCSYIFYPKFKKNQTTESNNFRDELPSAQGANSDLVLDVGCNAKWLLLVFWFLLFPQTTGFKSVISRPQMECNDIVFSVKARLFVTQNMSSLIKNNDK